MSKDTRPTALRRFLFFLKFLEIRLRFVFILLVTALVVGYWDNVQNYWERWQRQRAPSTTSKQAGAEHVHSEHEYYCPMHPFVIRDRPGKCPICGMDLSERKKGAPQQIPEGTLARVQVSPERVMQAGVQVEPVLYRLLANTIRSYGTIEAAETKQARIVPRFPGRVDELMVNATGLMVRKGEPLARIYSPKYLAAAQEYLQALEAQKRAESRTQASADEKRRAGELAGFARQRLVLAGFTKEQLDDIARAGKATENVTLYSPLSGIVLEKNVVLGDVVEEQTALYTISDLSTLWVQALVPERDIDAVKLGMPVEVTSVARPGEIFYGTVDFIYPTVNAENRSGKARVVVDNKRGELMPGMYVMATISSPVGKAEDITGQASGSARVPKKRAKVALPTQAQEAADQFLEGLPDGADYYVCPMHAEVVSDKKDDCPKCGMHLEERKKESAPKPVEAAPGAGSKEQWAEGFACPMHLDKLVRKDGICGVDACGMKMKKWRVERALSVPEAAVIDTGTRHIVYVESSPGVYDARAVKLGERAGAYYPVLEGLKLGDKIVARGSFLIDAEARLNPATAGSAPVNKEQGALSQHQHGK